MADVKSVVAKSDTAAAAMTPAAKAGWWLLRSPNRFACVVGGAVLAVVAGSYGYKKLTAPPNTGGTQPEASAVAQHKPAEGLIAPPAPGELDIKVPAIAPASFTSKNDIELPSITPPPSKPLDTEHLPIVMPPVIKPPLPNSPPDLPPPSKPLEDIKPPVLDPDLFRAPAPLPATVTDKKDKTPNVDPTPIIRVGAPSDTAPPPPPPPPATKGDAPSIVLPPVPSPINIDPPPATKVDPKVGPTPATTEPPPGKTPITNDPPLIPPVKLDAKNDAPRIPSPGIPDVPPPPVIGLESMPMPMPMPRTVAPGTLDPTPPVAPRTPEAKDMYDEDWHTERPGETYAVVSKEYYKTPDFAQALEAYNKERRKPGDRLVRVPPTWVLEEKFPNLVGGKSDKPGTPEVKTTGDLRFEPVSPMPTIGRSAPPAPAATTRDNDEYQVAAEAGEMMRDIARRVYGNPEQWKKIYELNPNVDPTVPIPSGTRLRLGR